MAVINEGIQSSKVTDKRDTRGYKMGWAARQKEASVKLELTWFDPRDCWKKKHSQGKVSYFHHPDSKAGYEAALQEWYAFKNSLNSFGDNAAMIDKLTIIFGPVQSWYDQFGVPVSETKLATQVSAFLQWLPQQKTDETLKLSVMQFAAKRSEFWSDFADVFVTDSLPDKWQDRVDRANVNIADKEPQTIGHWIEKYMTRVSNRAGKSIVEKTSDDRQYKLVHFTNWCDQLAHVTDINSEYLERYHDEVDSVPTFKKQTKVGYFKAFRMLVRWCSHQTACELVAPKNLESKEFKFREEMGTGRKRQEQKKLLWTPKEFNQAVDSLPTPYGCFLMLMLNCGFRHVDISNLRKVDIHLKAGRIVIQRNKLNQQETAPVVSYKLWPKTIVLLKKAMSGDPMFAFRNKRGSPVENSIKCWWKDHSDDYAKGKRLDYLRKTGSTIVAKHDPNLDEMYLGECLNSTAKISYSFNDGEPCQALDDAIGVLGAEFGFCEAPVKRVLLTAEVLNKLKKIGVDLETL